MMTETGAHFERKRRNAAVIKRISLGLPVLQAAISNRRAFTSNRFKRPSAWLRLVALGVLLVNLALLTLGNSLLGFNTRGYWPGMESVFAGLLIAVIIVKLAHPLVYMDWIALAVLEIALGVALEKETASASSSAFLVLALTFIALGLTKLWIGVTFVSGQAGVSLTAGGLAGLFCASCLLADRLSELGIGSQTIVATDLMITGFSIIGFGLALRPG